MTARRKKACMILDIATLLCLAVVVLCLCVRPKKLHYDVDRSVYPVKGVDISAHNGNVDFDRLCADTVKFVYMKATEGTDFCDANFSANYNGARYAGMKIGAYHFFRFNSPGHMQARHFLSTVGGRVFDMPLAIDVEKSGNPHNFHTDTVKSRLREMIEYIRGQGYEVILYTNKNGYRTFVEGDFDDMPVWICSLSSSPTLPWQIWQHSHIGKVKGVSREVDIDTYQGSELQFMQWAEPFTVASQ